MYGFFDIFTLEEVEMGKKTKDAPKLFSCSKCGNMFSEDELTASKCPEVQG